VLAIWAIGAVYIRLTGPETERYIAWLKVWVLLAGFLAVGASLALGAIFPDPTTSAILNGITNPSMPTLPPGLTDPTDYPTVP